MYHNKIENSVVQYKMIGINENKNENKNEIKNRIIFLKIFHIVNYRGKEAIP